MTRRELWNTIYDAALSAYDPQEAKALTAFVCEGRLGMRFTDVIVEPNAPYPDRTDLERILSEIRMNRPVQYITGFAYFLGRKFAVREGVLIPRPETEELVRYITAQGKDRQAGLRILDIGTGSGCIAVTLAAEIPEAEVVGVDVSEQALAIAGENGRCYGDRVHFLLCDILREQPEGMFDWIVSNPPYVTRREIASMLPNVVRYEPHQALFVEDDDPLLFYRVIGERGRTLLKQGGTLWFEINEQFGNEVVLLLQQQGYKRVRLMNDLYGKPRTVEAWR